MVPTREATDLGALLTLTAQGAGTLVSPVQENLECRGVKVVINVTAKSGTLSLIVTLQYHDDASDTDIAILTSASITGTGQTVLNVFPGAATTANLSANDVLPNQWSIKAVVSGTTPSCTATVSAITLK